MKFKDLIENLALGELSGTYMVETGQFNISPKYLPRLISVINRSLDNFYTIFPLKEKQVLIHLRKGISHYYLDSKFATSKKDDNLPKYVIDNDLNPFDDDVIKINGVATLDGRNVGIDDIFQPFSVMIPEYNCIHVPNDLGVEYLSITYQARHQHIPLSEDPASNFEINIPDVMLSAFMAYVACIALQSKGNHDISNAFFAKYQTQMEMLLNNGIGNRDHVGISILPKLRGWI